jgi:peptide/nickel transport system substrate-binding protein
MSNVKGRLFALALFVIVAMQVAGGAYGHGLSEDQAIPITVGEKQVTVMAKISPASAPVDPAARPTLLIRAHDENNNATIAGIDYRVKIDLRNHTLLDQRFAACDGIVLANLVPDDMIQGWRIAGHESAGPQDAVSVSQSSPVEITSRILSSGGLYHLEITLEKSSAGIVLQNDVRFDLFISVAHELSFNVQTGAGERQMVVKTYYDDPTDFSFENGTIAFAMPFNWDPNYVSQVSLLHMEVQFPKSIEELRTNSYNGTLNGVALAPASVLIDDFTSEQDRIVHFVVPPAKLAEISRELEDGESFAVFTLAGTGKPRFPLDLLSGPAEKYLLQLSWGPEVMETGVPVTFVMNVQDPATGDLLRGPYFDFVLTQGGSEIYRQRLQSELGTFAHKYTFSTPGIVMLSASNINGQGETSKVDLVILQGTASPPPQPEQPSGCLIATAAFGSELAPQVQYLRNFREQYILSTAAGSAFMGTFNSVYYSFSPQVADYERQQTWLQSVVKAGLYPLFGILMLSEQVHFGVGGGETGAVLAGVTASSLIGATYILPAGIALAGRVRVRWLAVAVGTAALLQLIAMAGAPQLLPASTAALVLAVAGSAALLAARLLLRVSKEWRNSRPA